jgi:alkylhydroperoxidase/carboxymuconolactone decarboxylase family protein YurZ
VTDTDRNSVGDYQRGIDTMTELWGAPTTEQMRDVWMKASPDAERYITAVSLGEVWNRPGLHPLTRCLVTLAASVALEREDQVRLHTLGALRSGASPQQIEEVIIHLMIYAGFPAGWKAMVASREVMTEFGKANLPDGGKGE